VELRKPAQPLPGAKFEESLKSGRPTMADFGAGWCKACKLMEPVLQIAAAKYEGKVNIVFSDTDEYGAVAKRHRVVAIPTQIFFDGKGEEVGRHVGYYPIEDLDAQLRSLGLIE
jgi:thioredoxin 1